MACSPTALLPAASAVAIWASVSALAVTAPFLGVSMEGKGGILWCDPGSGGWGKQGWKILLLGQVVGNEL